MTEDSPADRDPSGCSSIAGIDTQPTDHGRRDFLRHGAGMVALALLKGCAEREPVLRVATNVWPGYEFMHVAARQGLFPPNVVRMMQMPSATQVIQALAAGEAEAAGLTLDEVLTACADGLPLRVVAVLDVSMGGDAVYARPGLSRTEDIIGRTICVERSAVGAVMMDAFLDHMKLSPGQVQMVYANAQDHVEEYQTGAADLVVTFNPNTLLLDELGAQRLFDSSAIPGRIIDVIAATPRAIERCPQGIASLLAGHFQALNLWRTRPQSMTADLAREMGLPPERVAQCYAGLQMPDLAANREWFTGKANRLEQSARDLAALMVDADLLPVGASASGIAEPRFLLQPPP